MFTHFYIHIQFHNISHLNRGEEGYFCMQHYFAWAKRPMLQRVATDLHPDLPVSVMYGARSWVYRLNTSVMQLLQEARSDSYVASYLVEGASHHVHADKPDQFNATVRTY